MKSLKRNIVNLVNQIYLDEIKLGLLFALLPPSHPFYVMQKHFFTTRLIYNTRQIVLPLTEEDKKDKGRIYPSRGYQIVSKTKYFYQIIRKFK